ncbi:MAG: BrnA antitoxin family protein [Desulfuromonadales bacterium]
MKTDKKERQHIKRVKSDDTITPEIEAELKNIAAMSDDDIDTSDIPEISDWSNAVIGKFYRPVKEAVTVRLDADLLHWLKQGGKGYQSRLNAILRKEMTRQSAGMRKAA